MALELLNGKVKNFYDKNQSVTYNILANGLCSEADFVSIGNAITEGVKGKFYGLSLQYEDSEVVIPTGSGTRDMSQSLVWISRENAKNVSLKGKLPDSDEQVRTLFNGITTWGGVNIEGINRETGAVKLK